MGELAPLVSSTLAAYYEEVRDQVHKWVDPLFNRGHLAQTLSLRKQHWSPRSALDR